MPEYVPETIEIKWQRLWEEREAFKARPYLGAKFYCYNPAPYVTGALHMGHVRNYTYGDFLARFKRLHGASVLFTIGFDAFGVPTELAAIRKRIDPVEWTARCISEMKRQMRRMGFGFDWDRSFSTADPGYYRWTQWIFIEMFRNGLVYEMDAETLWCPKCDMALAKSLMVAGRCCLCHGEVESRVTRQWFLRVSRYLERLREDLDDVLDHNGQARAGQESLLAKRSLCGVRLEIPGIGTEIVGCLESPADWTRKLALAVHPQDWANRALLGLRPSDSKAPTRAGEANASADPDARETHGREGVTVVEPHSRRRFAALMDPSLDDLYMDQPRLKPCVGRPDEIETCEEPPGGVVPLTVYHQKDFSISRQRLWGTPIPIVRCETCGPVPVDSADLPVLLPPIESDSAGRLRRSGDEWRRRACPSCGRSAAIDPQVMDCHFDALWHYWRPCVTPGDAFPFGTEESRYWMPVDQIQFGRDTIPFLLTMRLLTKFMHDRGLSATSEFARETLAHGLILRNNKKMSKHLGNVVDPEESVARYGADSLRFYVLARSEPKSDYSWSDSSIAQYHDLLDSFYQDMTAAASTEIEGAARPSTGDAPTQKYITVFLTKVLREADILESSVVRGRFDIYARAVARILGALHLFRSRHYESAEPRARAAWAKCAELSVVYLAPIAPHLAEECWVMLGGRESVFEGTRWPSEGPSAIRAFLDALPARGRGMRERRE